MAQHVITAVLSDQESAELAIYYNVTGPALQAAMANDVTTFLQARAREANNAARGRYIALVTQGYDAASPEERQTFTRRVHGA